MKHPDYKNVTDWADHLGAIRWRYRKGGVTKYLPGEPHSPEFDAAYNALVAGKPMPKIAKPIKAEAKAAAPKKPVAEVVRIPGAAFPNSFTAAYRELKKTPKWQDLSDTSRTLYSNEIERFLLRPVAVGGTALWGDMPVADLRYIHLQKLMEDETIKTHMRHLMLTSVRKLIKIALRLEWIESDPSVNVEIAAATYTRGDQPWTEADHEKFCATYPPGTPARTCYGLARWMGNRRGDIFKLKWSDRETVRLRVGDEIVMRDGFWVEHEKGKKRRMVRGKAPKKLFQPMSPMLAEILAPLDKSTDTILVKRNGKPYETKLSLTIMMGKYWAPKAGLSKGHTLHGLRHANGATMAEAGVNTKDRMQVLGHERIEHAALYAQHADQIRAAIKAVDLVTDFVQPTKLVRLSKKVG